MTPEELTLARQKLGLSATKFAALVGRDDRTIRAWENGDSQARDIPRVVALLVRLMLKYPAVRRELGIEPHERKTRARNAAKGQSAQA